MKIFKKQGNDHKILHEPFGNLRRKMAKIPVKHYDVTSENTPTNREIRTAQVLQITIIFPVEWYNQSMSQNPRPMVQFGYDIFRIFEKHSYYISGQWEQNKFTAFFGENSVSDVNQLFQIGCIINSYYQTWCQAIGSEDFPGIKVVLEETMATMTKQERNFININSLNTNDFVILTTKDTHLDNLPFAKNAFFVHQSLVPQLTLQRQEYLKNKVGNYRISTFKAAINEEFQW